MRRRCLSWDVTEVFALLWLDWCWDLEIGVGASDTDYTSTPITTLQTEHPSQSTFDSYHISHQSYKRMHKNILADLQDSRLTKCLDISSICLWLAFWLKINHSSSIHLCFMSTSFCNMYQNVKINQRRACLCCSWSSPEFDVSFAFSPSFQQDCIMYKCSMTEC